MTATLLKALLAAVVLLPPAMAMGGTFPALVRAVSETRERAPGAVSVLYALNVLGAVVGSLLAGFVLPELFGERSSMLLTGLSNVLLGTLVLAAARGLPPLDPASVPPKEGPLASLRLLGASAGGRFVLAGLVVSGVTTMVVEIVFVRILGLVFGVSSYSFTLVLAVFLAGLDLGALVAGLLSRRRRPAASRLRPGTGRGRRPDGARAGGHAARSEDGGLGEAVAGPLLRRGAPREGRPRRGLPSPARRRRGARRPDSHRCARGRRGPARPSRRRRLPREYGRDGCRESADGVRLRPGLRHGGFATGRLRVERRGGALGPPFPRCLAVANAGRDGGPRRRTADPPVLPLAGEPLPRVGHRRGNAAEGIPARAGGAPGGFTQGSSSSCARDGTGPWASRRRARVGPSSSEPTPMPPTGPTCRRSSSFPSWRSRLTPRRPRSSSSGTARGSRSRRRSGRRAFGTSTVSRSRGRFSRPLRSSTT